jgi:FkbM family methyltransferase
MAVVDRIAAVSRGMPPFRGKRLLGSRLKRRAERRGMLNGTWEAQLRDGTLLAMPRESKMSWQVAFTGDYDSRLVEYLAQFIVPRTLVLDIGASIGLWTVQLAKAARLTDARVWAFEPNPANTTWIQTNLSLNGLTEAVTVLVIGLGDRKESVELVSAEYGVGNGVIPANANHIVRDALKFPVISISVDRLDDIELPERVSLIKIDTEGYELAFLRGAEATIARDRPVIYGEFSPRWLERRGEDIRSMIRSPLLSGYSVSVISAPRARPWSNQKAEIQPVDLESPGPLPGGLLFRPTS